METTIRSKDTKETKPAFVPYYNYNTGILKDFTTPLHYPGRTVEVFKDLDLYGIEKNKYVISSYGRVFSKNKKIVLQQEFRDSFKSVRLMRENKEYSDYYVHDLVAFSFIDNAKELIHETVYVKHINEVRSCNYAENLTISFVKKDAHTSKYVPNPL